MWKIDYIGKEVVVKFLTRLVHHTEPQTSEQYVITTTNHKGKYSYNERKWCRVKADIDPRVTYYKSIIKLISINPVSYLI